MGHAVQSHQLMPFPFLRRVRNAKTTWQERAGNWELLSVPYRALSRVLLRWHLRRAAVSFYAWKLCVRDLQQTRKITRLVEQVRVIFSFRAGACLGLTMGYDCRLAVCGIGWKWAVRENVFVRRIAEAPVAQLCGALCILNVVLQPPRYAGSSARQAAQQRSGPVPAHDRQSHTRKSRSICGDQAADRLRAASSI